MPTTDLYNETMTVRNDVDSFQIDSCHDGKVEDFHAGSLQLAADERYTVLEKSY